MIPLQGSSSLAAQTNTARRGARNRLDSRRDPGREAPPAEALANPYHRHVTFTYGFFNFANLEDTITDSHFVTRDRMGRTLAFLARQIQDGQAQTAWSARSASLGRR